MQTIDHACMFHDRSGTPFAPHMPREVTPATTKDNLTFSAPSEAGSASAATLQVSAKQCRKNTQIKRPIGIPEVELGKQSLHSLFF
jgi:hypothetical protein